MRYSSGLVTVDAPGDPLPEDVLSPRQDARIAKLRAFMQERKDSGPLSAAKQEKCLAVLVRYILADASEDAGL
jgi:hypothetical protein